MANIALIIAVIAVIVLLVALVAVYWHFTQVKAQSNSTSVSSTVVQSQANGPTITVPSSPPPFPS